MEITASRAEDHDLLHKASCEKLHADAARA